MQPLRSVGRSNFDKGRHNLTTLIQKSTYINEKLLYNIYICIYIYYVYNIYVCICTHIYLIIIPFIGYDIITQSSKDDTLIKCRRKNKY